MTEIKKTTKTFVRNKSIKSTIQFVPDVFVR
jgi:hypothetical protein